MTAAGLVFRRLLFSSDGLPDASIDFEPGLNIIFGGSNAGKSFILSALDFMLGAGELSLPREGQAYTRVYLWLSLPENEDITLYRSASGGDLRWYKGFISDSQTSSSEGSELKATARKGSKQSISTFILEKLGIRGAKIAKNQQGDLNQVTLRTLSPYLLVAETEMISKASPIAQRGARLTSADKSLFRYLLSGKDDSDIVAVPNADKLRANRDGKVELLKDLIETTSQRTDKLGSLDELEEAKSELEAYLAEQQSLLAVTQSELDELQLSRRQLFDARNRASTKTSELRTMRARFAELDAVYQSDVERLQGLEEAGFLTELLGAADCPICGALPESQLHSHGLEAIPEQRDAIQVELKKTIASREELALATFDLNGDLEDVSIEREEIGNEISQVEKSISALRPLEGNLRREFRQASENLSRLDESVILHRQLAEYQGLLDGFAKQTFGKQMAEGLELGISTHLSSEFCKVVLEVLEAWGFPDTGPVSFSDRNQDIIVNGRERHDNGKGVRAILHSAFKVSLALFCRNKGLPHPQTLVLDSPLVTYRGPLQTAKYGELEEDEKRVKSTSLNYNFYHHLASSFANSQVIVLENQNPPDGISDHAAITMFGGEKGQGREGFFPPTRVGNRTV